jgi:fumarate hydratase class I
MIVDAEKDFHNCYNITVAFRGLELSVLATKKILDITDNAVELIRLCACVLRKDVTDAITVAKNKEPEGSMARSVFDSILENAKVASKNSIPMCQDTGMPIFWVHYPKSMSQSDIKAQILKAIKKATSKSYLRPNTIEALTGKNPGDNTGLGTPAFHFEQWNKKELKVSLLLKGGGSENVSYQYKLPDIGLSASRDLDGVRRCVLDTLFRAQGEGCAPGVIGVCIGGARDTGYEAAKEALLRDLKNKNPDPSLRELEDRLVKEIDSLGIGPMGFGGKTTALGVKVTTLARHPATYYVSVAYNCWALRRYSMTIAPGKGGARYE